jgi:hypothetical protein
MTVYRRSILGDSLASAGSADGTSANPQTDPFTGQPNPHYAAPKSSTPLTATGNEDQFTRVRLGHNEQAYKQSQSFVEHAVDGADGSLTGAGLAISWDTPANDKFRVTPADYNRELDAAKQEQGQ